MMADAATAEPSDPTQSLIGQVIGGRYRVTSVIGQGGMGVVYGALHLELEQPVAIKVLPATYARNLETLKRFEQEAKTASRVKHPNVVQVFDLGRLSTGEPYLAMELLDGEDLESVLQTKVLSRAEILDILRPMAAALDALHRQNVVHRDVKPSNVFFARSSSGGQTIKLVDFGLATLTAAGEGAERLTRVGHVVGTAVYMPPEAARGALCEPAGDIYSLAVMAFELLAGGPPFDGQPMAVLMDKVSQRAPTLSEISRTTFGPEIEALFASALDRDIARRPATAADFVQRLERALAHEQPTAAVPSPASVGREARAPTADLVRVGADDELPTRTRVPLFAGLALLALTIVMGGYFAVRPSAVTTATPTPRAPVAPTEARLDIDVRDQPVVTAVEPIAAVETTTARPRLEGPRPSRTSAPVPDRAVTAEPIAPAHPPPVPPTEEATSAETTPRSTERSASLVRDASSAMLHGEIPRALELYREATLSSPRNAAAWRGLGLASERLHLVPEARTAYERYLQLAPEAGDAPTVRDRLTRLGT